MAEPDRTLPRRRRLRNPAEFRRVFARPCRVGDARLTFLARPNGLTYPRLGLAIAKRHVKTAVERNRIKRQVRESFRLHQHLLGGLDIVVLARAGITGTPRHVLRPAIDRQWKRLLERCAA